jgi:hypothetical protein
MFRERARLTRWRVSASRSLRTFSRENAVFSRALPLLLREEAFQFREEAIWPWRKVELFREK